MLWPSHLLPCLVHLFKMIKPCFIFHELTFQNVLVLFILIIIPVLFCCNTTTGPPPVVTATFGTNQHKNKTNQQTIKTYMWLLTLKVHLYVHGQFKCSEGAGGMKYWIWTCAKEQGMRHLLKGAASKTGHHCTWTVAIQGYVNWNMSKQ